MSTEDLKRKRRYINGGALLAVGAFLAFVLSVGGSDYDEAVAYEAFYCQMVDEGTWPPVEGHQCPEKPEPLVARNIASL